MNRSLVSRFSVIAAISLLTASGGALDAWVFLDHGHVFANAQSGNVVLIGIDLADGDMSGVVRRLSPLGAYVLGLVISRLAASRLKRRGSNSRTIRLCVEALLLVALALSAGHLPDAVITASVGFVAALQITSLSHLGSWSFNTGMTTGNMRSAAVAFVAAVDGRSDSVAQGAIMLGLCIAFAAGAVTGAWCAPILGNATLLVIAAAVALAAFLCRHEADPLPDWAEL